VILVSLAHHSNKRSIGVEWNGVFSPSRARPLERVLCPLHIKSSRSETSSHLFDITWRRHLFYILRNGKISSLIMAHDIICCTHNYQFFTGSVPCTLYHMLLYPSYLYLAVETFKEGNLVFAILQNIGEEGPRIIVHQQRHNACLLRTYLQCGWWYPCFTAMIYFPRVIFIHGLHTWLTHGLGNRHCCRRKKSSVSFQFVGEFFLVFVLFKE
jgi:hypothetical protein